jgi:hypothetical protein
MKGMLTTKQFSERVGLTIQRIQQLIKIELIQAEKVGRDYLIAEKYVDIINSRPERRGNYDRRKAA